MSVPIWSCIVIYHELYLSVLFHHHHHHFICSEQATQHMTANANEQDQKAQRALKMALNA